ncbi:MAG: inositol monophosphatase [Thermoplasmata archaeon HGW-Thermoplasmata-2]|nr:MAG: inositol monophosphatase [Thermoplasmata archaeon HGW-Thermoplasmata-2]
MNYRYGEYLKLAREIADGIGRIVSENAGNMREMGKKAFIGAYGAPTSRIDAFAEERALEIIKESGMELNVLTEERGIINRSAAGACETLILDPIDGTTNCIAGIPFYAVSVAFAKGDIGGKLSDVFFGYVKNLPANEEYIAAKGEGARLLTGGREIQILPENAASAAESGAKPIRASVYLGSFAEPPEFLRKIRYLRSMGSASLEMCLVAKGALDFYYFHSAPEHRLRIVDIAASTLIARESGGVVLGENGKELEMAIDLKDRKNLVAARNKKALAILV